MFDRTCTSQRPHNYDPLAVNYPTLLVTADVVKLCVLLEYFNILFLVQIHIVPNKFR